MQKLLTISSLALVMWVLCSPTGSAIAQNGFRTGQYDGQAKLQYDGRASHRDGIGPSDLASGVARGSFGVPGPLGGVYRNDNAYIDNNANTAINPGNCGEVYRSYDRASGTFLGYGDMRTGCR